MYRADREASQTAKNICLAFSTKNLRKMKEVIEKERECFNETFNIFPRLQHLKRDVSFAQLCFFSSLPYFLSSFIYLFAILHFLIFNSKSASFENTRSR